MKMICGRSTSGELLPPKVEFGNITLEGCTFEHCLFMKQEKLDWKFVLLNVDFWLHHVTSARTVKDAWENLCATFEKIHLGKILKLCKKLYNFKMEECIFMQVHIDKLQMVVDQLSNIDHPIFNEDWNSHF